MVQARTNIYLRRVLVGNLLPCEVTVDQVADNGSHLIHGDPNLQPQHDGRFKWAAWARGVAPRVQATTASRLGKAKFHLAGGVALAQRDCAILDRIVVYSYCKRHA